VHLLHGVPQPRQQCQVVGPAELCGVGCSTFYIALYVAYHILYTARTYYTELGTEVIARLLPAHSGWLCWCQKLRTHEAVRQGCRGLGARLPVLLQQSSHLLQLLLSRRNLLWQQRIPAGALSACCNALPCQLRWSRRADQHVRFAITCLAAMQKSTHCCLASPCHCAFISAVGFAAGSRERHQLVHMTGGAVRSIRKQHWCRKEQFGPAMTRMQCVTHVRTR
jgi:hypothetical protein